MSRFLSETSIDKKETQTACGQDICIPPPKKSLMVRQQIMFRGQIFRPVGALTIHEYAQKVTVTWT